MADESDGLARLHDDERSRWRRPVLAVVGLTILGGIAYGAYTLFFAGDDTSAPAASQQTAVVTKGRLISSYTGTGTAQSTLSTSSPSPARAR